MAPKAKIILQDDCPSCGAQLDSEQLQNQQCNTCLFPNNQDDEDFEDGIDDHFYDFIDSDVTHDYVTK